MTPWVMIHGWGQSSHTWHEVCKRLKRHGVPCETLDLPGHGGSKEAPKDMWLDLLIKNMPNGPVILLGWSLGGILAMEMARCVPDRIRGLVLLSTTPAFTSRAGWPYGCQESLLHAFKADALNNPKRLLRRFSTMMFAGEKMSARRYREVLAQSMRWDTLPSAYTLIQGLETLQGMDLRRSLPKIEMPSLVVHGGADRVIPKEAGVYLAAHLPKASMLVFSDVGHAPHLSRPAQLVQAMLGWSRWGL